MDPLYIVLILGGLLAAGLVVYTMTTRNQLVRTLNEMDQRQKSEAETLRQALDSGLSKGREEAAARSKENTELIANVRERLVAISEFKDSVKQSVSDLNESVTGVKRIFDNPNKRGLFGESQLKDIVTTALPTELYEFQHRYDKLDGGYVTFDCFLKLPDPPGPIGIDAKFPSELYRNIAEATTPDAQKEARKQFEREIKRLLGDIADKYIIPEVTSEFALMFVPSEAIFAEIYSSSPSVTEVSHKRRVYIVSPSTLMAALNTIRSVVNTMNVQRAAEQVLKGLAEVAKDAERLQKRTEDFQKRLSSVLNKTDEVVTSSRKINERVQKMQGGNTESLTSGESSTTPLSNGQELPDRLT